MSENPLIPQSSERLSPNEIASKTFTVTRRGFKPEEVNRYLALIGSYIAEQHRLYDTLASKVKSQGVTTPQVETPPVQRVDLASITSALGEEAAEILKSATAAGESIRAKANEYARSVREAADNAVAEQEAAHRLEMVEELRVHRAEIDRITQEANTKITSEVQRAEELARTLVHDARSDADSIIRKAKEVRAEVYAEIDRRTSEAREVLQLIESQKAQLTLELRGVKRALDSLLSEVDPEESNESHTTNSGEQASVVESASEVRIDTSTEDNFDEVENEVDHQGFDQDQFDDVEVEIEVPRQPVKVFFFDDTESSDFEVADSTDQSSNGDQRARGGLGQWPSIKPESSTLDGTVSLDDEIAALDDAESYAADDNFVVETAGIEGERIEASKTATQSEKRHGDHFVVENIFSRLLERSDEEKGSSSNQEEFDLDEAGSDIDIEAVAEVDLFVDEGSETAAESLPETVSTLYEDSFSSLKSQATRRIKRVVQDDQNALLEGLRIGGIDEAKRIIADTDEIARAYADVMATFVQPIVEQSSRYFQQIQRVQGVPDGRWNVSVKPSVEMRAAVDELAVELAEEVSSRVLGVIGAGMGDDLAALSTRLGATFRELKTEFVETLVSDMISILVSTWLITCTDVAKVTWVRGGPGGCADCEDNELEGIIDVGSNFPTGNPAPPAHIGCRCLLVPYFA